MPAKKKRYCIVYIRDTKHQRLLDVVKKYMPKEHGEAFYPCMEYYKRGEKAVKVRPMFQGYVFLYTDYDIVQVHELIRSHRTEIGTGTRELGLAEKRASDMDFLVTDEGEEREEEVFDLSDVSEEEEKFLDCLREGNGLLTMSSGYEERKKKYIVVEGPLKAYEERIVYADKHNRKAFLEFEFNGTRAQAGFNCFPKAHWFPDADSRIATLSDGTEVDLNDLRKQVMTIQ